MIPFSTPRFTGEAKGNFSRRSFLSMLGYEDDGKVPPVNGYDQRRGSTLLECSLRVRPSFEAEAGAVGVAVLAGDEEWRGAI